MAISNFSRIVVAHSVQGEDCDGCGYIFSGKDINRIYKTTTNHLFCKNCFNSDFDFEAYVNLIENNQCVDNCTKCPAHVCLND